MAKHYTTARFDYDSITILTPEDSDLVTENFSERKLSRENENLRGYELSSGQTKEVRPPTACIFRHWRVKHSTVLSGACTELNSICFKLKENF